jgi:hypothetical protein
MTEKKKLDRFDLMQEFLQRMGFEHECRGMMFCQACAFEFSTEGKAAFEKFFAELEQKQKDEVA